MSVLLFVLLLSSNLMGQTFTCSVQNACLAGTDYKFDIYILRTGGTELYLGNADLVLTFNPANFTGATYVIDRYGTSKLETYYALAASIVSTNRLVLNVGAPAPATQTQFINRVEVISNSGTAR